MATTTVKPLRVLITRPEPQASALQQQLTAAGIYSQCTVLFDYCANGTGDELQALLTQTAEPMIIFVSAAAVTFAEQCLALANWPKATLFAVGQQTAATLRALTDQPVLSPEQQNSEGLLALPELNAIAGRQIIIVRGDGGRELLADELRARGGHVSYFESYRRRWHEISNETLDQWKNSQINCIVITSNALLDRVVELLSPLSDYWRQQCQWLVASARIATAARQYGLTRVCNIDSASNQKILARLSQHGTEQ